MISSAAEKLRDSSNVANAADYMSEQNSNTTQCFAFNTTTNLMISMLGSSKSNIYISVVEAKKQHVEDVDTYHRPQLVWMISIEPHRSAIPGLAAKHIEPIHLTATSDDGNEGYSIGRHGAENQETEILGNILVGENAKTTADHIEKLLKEKLSTGAAQDESDHWIRRALHILQHEHILSKFDIAKFMTYAHTYAADRGNNEASAMIAYSMIDKNHKEKSQRKNFWIDYPMASKAEPKDLIEGNQRKYGGLM
ncbi:hypothetical protein HII31_02777 [Pseudocercospora fuligena]|uniref:Uncharacterized protein n=1 Tax=Pseudocercospora fuligena TaxID=685502 RepID=A0A8H6VMM8_9PEZI|nr:hypothetical protein HII31_02777 [Pseudocercospora fuligena]